MNEKEREDLYGKVSALNALELKKTANEYKIIELTKNIQSNMSIDLAELAQERSNLLNDKDLRTKHGITNQKAWESKIKNKLTKETETAIRAKYAETEAIIESLEKNVKLDRIKLKCLERQYRIDLAYYSQPNLKEMEKALGTLTVVGGTGK